MRSAHREKVQNENLSRLIDEYPAEEQNKITMPDITTVHVIGGEQVRAAGGGIRTRSRPRQSADLIWS